MYSRGMFRIAITIKTFLNKWGIKKVLSCTKLRLKSVVLVGAEI